MTPYVIQIRAMSRPLAIVLLMICGLTLIPGLVYACSTSLDVSDSAEQSWFPEPLLLLKRNDTFAYTVHAVLATTLELNRCNTEATTLQWLKAGSHSRGVAGSTFAVFGFRVTQARSGLKDMQPYVCEQFAVSLEDHWLTCRTTR